jgi:transglutaminase-like putative cysteine protease
MIERLQYPPVYLGIFFLLMTAVTAVMFTVASPLMAVIYSLFWGIVFAAGLIACRRAGEQQLAQFQQHTNAAAAVALVLCIGGLVLSGVETGLLLLLLTIQAGRNLVLSTRRDLNFACLISLVLILYASGTAKDSYFIAFIILYSLAGMFTFMADHIDARLAHAQGGDRQLLSRGMSLPAKGLGLACLTIALAFVIYLIVPRLPSPRVKAMPSSSVWNYDNRNWQAEASRPQPKGTGSGNSNAGKKSSGAAVVTAAGKSGLDVTVTGAQVQGPDPIVLNLQSDRPVYARGEVFDTFDGLHWNDSNSGVQKRFNPDGRFSFGSKQNPGETLQIYTIRHELAPSILASYQPLQLAFPGNVIETDSAMTMRAPDRLRKGTVYSVISSLDEVDRHPCSGIKSNEEQGLERYLALYPEISDRLRQLAGSITKQSGDDFGRAKAIETYLRENYSYTRETMMVTWTSNPVEQFLFELKAGHCELFASSMTIMLRSVGIPARLINGFYIQRYNPVTGYYEAKASDRHAWVEAYIEPHGWVTFEPTSSFELPRCSKQMFVASSLFNYVDENMLDLLRQHGDSLWVKILHKLWIILVKLKLALILTYMQLQLAFHFIWFWFLRGGWILLLLLLAAGVAAWQFWRFYEPTWRMAKLRRARNGDPHTFLRLCYREMERFFDLRGTVRAPQITALEYEQLLVRRFMPLSEPITVITRLFQKAAYGPEPLTATNTNEAYSAIEKLMRSKLPASRKTFRFNCFGRNKRT